jgi:hypothetical protein
VIRLGSLAGYPFEGPRLLAGWTPPERAAVFAVMYKPDTDAKPEEYAVLYVSHADDLSAARLPFDHPVATCWLSRVGNKRFDLYIGTYEAPGANARHREQIARELIAIYHPGCNGDQYDQAWEAHWIGDYQTPGTTGPLTTRREPPGAGG